MALNSRFRPRLHQLQLAQSKLGQPSLSGAAGRESGQGNSSRERGEVGHCSGWKQLCEEGLE